MHDAPPGQIANVLVDAALQHAGEPLSDDVAIVVIRLAERPQPLPG